MTRNIYGVNRGELKRDTVFVLNFSFFLIYLHKFLGSHSHLFRFFSFDDSSQPLNSSIDQQNETFSFFFGEILIIIISIHYMNECLFIQFDETIRKSQTSGIFFVILSMLQFRSFI